MKTSIKRFLLIGITVISAIIFTVHMISKVDENSIDDLLSNQETLVKEYKLTGGRNLQARRDEIINHPRIPDEAKEHHSQLFDAYYADIQYYDSIFTISAIIVVIGGLMSYVYIT